MKVLFHHFTPFSLAHGGQQIQIERTRAALQELGIDVEYLRWFDGTQKGDILHFFGRLPAGLLLKARDKGMKVVIADLLGAQAARTPARLAVQKVLMRGIQSALPRLAATHFDWDSYRMADACIAVTSREAELLTKLFEVPAAKVHVVPNGIEEIFLRQLPATRGKWLVCVGTITEVKRTFDVAQAAIRAETPIWFVGKPYAESDRYAQQFIALAKSHPEIIRYEGAVAHRESLARIYREARGFVLLSAWESLSLSALEAAACACPLLLSDLPWAQSVFRDKASFCPLTSSSATTAARLREFYDAAPTLPTPPKPQTWSEIATQLKQLYTRL